MTVAACLMAMQMAHAQSDATPFIKPAALAPAVEFWKRVYTEVGTTGGFIHDHTYLGVVYRTVEFAPGTPGSLRSARIEQEKQLVSTTLNRLANGDEQLSADEQRIRDAWPADTPRHVFRDAADRVRFQLGQADRFKEGLIRSGRWRDEIRRIFKSQGLPEQLAVLPHVESSFNPYAYSKVGAAGMWQFMRSTGKRFLSINNVIDERLDPYKSTQAAASFMRQNFAIVENWPLAITAYNHGAGGMRRAKDQLGTDDISEIVRRYDSKSFGFASRNFYACFLAALEIDSEPERYFPGLQLEPPDSSKIMPVAKFTSMPALLRSLQLDQTELKQLNPSLMATVWKGSKHIPAGFELRVPGAERGTVASAIKNLPASAVATAQEADTHHRVRRGETLTGIAARYGLRVNQLATANGLRQPYHLKVGALLLLPGASQATTDVLARQTSSAESSATNVASPPEAPLRHKVKRGDTLDAIARRYQVASSELLALNKLSDANAIKIGQSLLIRAAGVEVANAGEPDETQVTPTDMARVENAEPKTEREADALGPTLLPGVEAAASADPADYAVRNGGTIRVEMGETLGHYATWLSVSQSRLRRLNRLSSADTVRLGQMLKLDLSKTRPAQFEAARTAFHQQMQDSFFAAWRIVGTTTHVLKKGESVWELSQKTYNIPAWLLHQYNPDVDLAMVTPGTRLTIPTVESLPQNESSPSP